MIYYFRDVIPCLQDFLRSRGKSFSSFQHFSIPKFVSGDDTQSGEGNFFRIFVAATATAFVLLFQF
jgi:hypothetical protein